MDTMKKSDDEPYHSLICPLCRAYTCLPARDYPFPRPVDIRPNVQAIVFVARRQQLVFATRRRKKAQRDALHRSAPE